MNNIWGLIKKDLLNLSSYKTSLLILIIFCAIAIGSTGTITFVPIIVCAITGMIALSTFNYDETSQADKYILSLPVTRQDIVLSKFILAISSTIIGALLGFLFTIFLVNILNIIRPDSLIILDYNNLLTTTIGAMFGISLIQSIQIPSIYKWGAEKGRIQMFVLIFVLVVLILGISYLVMNSNFNINLEDIVNFMNKFGIITLILAMIIMYYISFKLSLKIFKHKDY